MHRSIAAFRFAALVIASICTALALTASAASGPNGATAAFEDCPPDPRRRDDDDDDEETVSRPATTTDAKLSYLINAGVTSAEMALATSSSLRAVEDRRRALRDGKTKMRVAKFDCGIDDLYSIFSVLEDLKIEPTNIRAWLIGRSRFLEEQRPAVLLSAGEFEIVREAAIAYATNETPTEFLADRDPLPRPVEPVEA